MSSTQESNIFFAVSEYGEYNEMLLLAQCIEQEFSVHPIFIFSNDFSLKKDQTQILELKNWSWLQLGTSYSSFYTEDEIKSEDGYFWTQEDKGKKYTSNLIYFCFCFGIIFIKYLLKNLSTIKDMVLKKNDFSKQNNNCYKIKKIFKTSRYFLNQIKQADKFTKLFKPKLIISGQDYVLSVTSILTKVAERYNIHTVIIPFSMPPTTKEIIKSFSYLGINKLTILEEFIYKNMLSPWINHYRGSFYTRLNPYYCYLSDNLGLSPPKPWVPNSGRGIIFVSSDWFYQYYIKAGIPESQLKITGAFWNDAFDLTIDNQKKENRKKILLSFIDNKKKLPKSNRIIIVSWPPNQYPRKAFGFDNYLQLCEGLCKTLNLIKKIFDVNIIISLHPTLQNQYLLKTLNKHKLCVIYDKLIDYIDLADIFIGVVSSVNLWALSCHIPTINFDCYGYGYPVFQEAGAIDAITTTELFTACYKLLDNEQEFLARKEIICEKVKPYVIKDGCSKKRILTSLKELMAP